jgi:hypothetical protein
VTGTLTYLDASALMRNAESSISSCSERNRMIRPVIRSIMEDYRRELACSEFTLMEFHSNLTTNWRHTGNANYDEAWWHRSWDEVFSLIREQQLRVLPTTPRILEEAMALITVATRDYGAPVRSWDAVHMLIANQWSFRFEERVDIVTSDAHFDFAFKYPGFATLSVLNLDILAKTGHGADKTT